MRIRQVEIKNFRLLADVELVLEDQTTVIVGRNNSGKTSLSEVMRRLLSEGSAAFHLEDFSSACYDHFCEALQALNQDAEEDAVRALIPTIELRLRSHSDKTVWHDAMTQLVALRQVGTVGQVVEHLRAQRKPRLPDAVEKRERELRDFDKSAGIEMPRGLEELEKLRGVAYSEVKALRRYLDGHSPFETKHGVKGAEFENVLVVVGRGWNQYNFGEMLELAGAQAIPAAKEEAFERNRNLFYVACSRPQKRLAILFTQLLSSAAMATLESWFGADALTPAP